jgi:SUKH superfamily protein
MDIEDFKNVLTPPVEPFQAIGDWAAVEAELGTSLPSDYKQFIEAYGTGKINDFIMVFNPFASNRYVNLIEAGTVVGDAYRTSRANAPEYYDQRVYPEPGGLLAVARTDNGNDIYWRTVGQPDAWTVVAYQGRGPNYYDYRGSLTEFLSGLLTRTLLCDVFPDDAFRSSPEFRVVTVQPPERRA